MNVIYTVPTPAILPAWDITLSQWLHGPEVGTKACAICGVRFDIPKRNRGKLFCGKKCAHVYSYRTKLERTTTEENEV
jgi:hypothetical protein